MNTPLTTKLAALALALMVNSVILGGVAVVFSDRAQAYTAATVGTILATEKVA